MSQSGVYGSGGGGGGIITIDGNSSFVTGSTVTLSVPANNGTPVFTGNGTTTMSLTFDDIHSNLGLGLGSVKAGSGNIGIGGSAGELCNSSSQGNCLLGSSAGARIVSGNNNCMIGEGAGFPIGSGSFNLLFGLTSGLSLGIADSSNIYFNTTGPGTESNVLRIGQATGSSDQDLANAYICGIQGVNVGSVASVVAISGDHLGSTTITAGTGITVTPGANTITIAASGGGSMVLIQTQTASSVTSLAFTTGITGTYNNYKILFDNFSPATTSSDLLVQISINGGGSYINTGYIGSSGTTTGLPIIVSLPTGDTSFSYGNADLYNFTSGVDYVSSVILGGCTFDTIANSVTQTNVQAGIYSTIATTVNALQIVTDDGTAFSGTFSLYGLTM